MARVLEFHVTGRRLLTGLLLTVVPISVAAIYLSGTVGERAEQDAGRDLQTIAESVSSLVRERVDAKVVEAAMMASDAAVRSAVEESNRQYERVYEERIQQMLAKRDEKWSTPAGQEAAAEMLANEASAALRAKLRVQPALLRITVTDRRGGTVAATHKTIDYYQGDEEYWQDIFATGRGAVSLTDVLYDEASKHYYIGVGVPVVDDNNNMIGTLDSLVDISQLFPLIHRNELGADGRMALVRHDGTVIAGTDGVSLADRAVSADFNAVLDARDSFRESAAGYLTAPFPQEGERIVASPTRDWRATTVGWTGTSSRPKERVPRSPTSPACSSSSWGSACCAWPRSCSSRSTSRCTPKARLKRSRSRSPNARLPWARRRKLSGLGRPRRSGRSTGGPPRP